MNREEHLYKTLPFNLTNSNFPGVELEYIILDYSSKVNVAAEVVHRYKQLAIDNNISLKVFRIEGLPYFDFSHAKNVAHKLATKEIVCSVDSDNYVLSQCTGYLKFIFEQYEDPITHGWLWLNGSYGRVALRKDSFMRLGGYEEALGAGWGWEDQNILNRTSRLPMPFIGGNGVTIPDIFLRVEDHDEKSRNANTGVTDNIWKRNTEKQEISTALIAKYGEFANVGREWGMAKIEQYL